MGFLFLCCNTEASAQQAYPFSREEFNQEVFTALSQHNDQLAADLISQHRLFVKSFVNDLIIESIQMELKGMLAESEQLMTMAEDAANFFEETFGEKSLAIGVGYLASWTQMQKEKKLLADSLSATAAVLRGDSENNDLVAELYAQSLALYREIGDERGEADILGGYGLLYYGVDFEKALDYYQQALAKREKVDDRQLMGNSLNSIGSIYYSYFQDFVRALSYYEKADAIRAEIGDSIRLGITVHTEASAAERAGQYEKSLACYLRSYEINAKTGDAYRAAEAMLNSGAILNALGRYPEALENLEEALEINILVNDSLGMGVVYNQIGLVYANLGDYNTSIENISHAADIMEILGDMWELAGVYNHLGIVLQYAGRTERALEYYVRSLELFEEMEDPYNMIGVLSNLGTLFFDMKEYERADEYLERSLQVSREIKDRDQEVRCLLNLANNQMLSEKLDDALANYEQADDIARSLNNPELIWRVTAGMAENYEQRGEYDKSLQMNDAALAILEELRSTLPDENWKASYMAMERFAFEDVISMLGDLHERYPSKGYDTVAFRYAERSKSRAFLDLLAGSLASVDEEADPELLRKQDEWMTRINETRQKLQNESLAELPDTQTINALKEDLERSEDELEKIRKEIRTANPQYADLRFPQPVTLEDVQALCPDQNTVFLEYSLGDSSSCLWVITLSGHQMHMLPDRQILQDQIDILRFALTDPDQDNQTFLQQAGYSLYKTLVEPAEPFLSAKSKIVIIPDGILTYLPFEALLTEPSETEEEGSYKDLPYLVKQYPVSYVQSASVLKSLLADQADRGPSSSGTEKLIAFGDPVYEGTSDASATPVRKFNRLEYSGKEVEEIASFFPAGHAVTFLREEASEDQVKQNDELQDFSYVHFATHGLIDEDNPDFSSLVMSVSENSPEDGYLQAAEIFNLKLDADLVVLSACQTALGKMVRGEGMVGLTRAFMYAGTPSVLASLWSVYDISTATLMGTFYEDLIKNKYDKTDALREAQLSLINDGQFAHPFYWAPFVLIGNWR